MTKVKHAQEAGAAAVVIADDGRCSEDFVCDHFLGSRDMKKYFAITDSEVLQCCMCSAVAARADGSS